MINYQISIWSIPNLSFYSEDPDGNPHTRIVLRFKPNTTDPEEILKKLVTTGHLGEVPIFNDYLSKCIPQVLIGYPAIAIGCESVLFKEK